MTHRSKPLTGRRVVVTRAAEQAGKLAAALTAQGADVVALPTIAIRPPRSWRRLDRALQTLAAFDWLVFTSANAVEAFFDRLWSRGFDLRALADVRLGVVGPGTAEALQRWHLRADCMPRRLVAEALARALIRHGVRGRRVLFPRAEQGRDALAESLTAAGAAVTRVDAYRSIPVRYRSRDAVQRLLDPPVAAITFASAQTARNFVAAVGTRVLPRLRGHVRVASIGPQTSAALRALGLPADVEASPSTIPALVRAVVRSLRDGR